MPHAGSPIPREEGDALDQNHSPERQRGVAEKEFRGCLSETDTNILREEKRLSVIPITGQG